MSAAETYACFNKHGKRNGHYFSAMHLYDCGVWIGYLAPERHGERFRNLPSFNELKTNSKRYQDAYPPTIPGKVTEGRREAICRACFTEQPATIELMEISFTPRNKLVIMRLDGTDKDGMFCILVPQPNDRSLAGLQPYRPYEIINDGRGYDLVNNFCLLVLRNKSQHLGLLETANEVLTNQAPSIPETEESTERTNSISPIPSHILSDMALPAVAQPIPSVGSSIAIPVPIPEPQPMPSPMPSVVFTEHTIRVPETNGNNKRPAPQDDDQNGPPLKRHDGEVTPVSKRTTQLPATPISTETTVIPPNRDLVASQSQRVRIIWNQVIDDTEYEYIHTMYECDGFKGLQRLLAEDSEHEPEAAQLLAEARLWRFAFQLPGARKKVTTLRTESEVGFERLQDLLAKSSALEADLRLQIDLQLTILK
ncbi:hypothetical protein BS50DRAFT_634657 [Corynespora cassiicola Philippines]|uniref:Uncharacterized protein n=1 Tax=Corynespora cassiicola Philippines TaxID=1448308 RepID=A0A2T2NPB1_CORCC|nr:hypothetical protein BS50DRAFT_634657 [Corynespora cassiicola Philippines]